MHEEYQHNDLTSLIIKCFYEVYNELGYGFLEKVYENALKIELESCGLEVASQQPIKVTYKGVLVGKYYADLVVNNDVIIELKATSVLNENHAIQLTNYLKSTQVEVGLLLNFGEVPDIRRRVFSND